MYNRSGQRGVIVGADNGNGVGKQIDVIQLTLSITSGQNLKVVYKSGRESHRSKTVLKIT